MSTEWLAEARLRPRGLRRGSLRYEGACLAEAGVACEGWWSQAGSNRRPLACHASALPAELWPLNVTSAPWATRVAAAARAASPRAARGGAIGAIGTTSPV